MEKKCFTAWQLQCESWSSLIWGSIRGPILKWYNTCIILAPFCVWTLLCLILCLPSFLWCTVTSLTSLLFEVRQLTMKDYPLQSLRFYGCEGSVNADSATFSKHSEMSYCASLFKGFECFWFCYVFSNIVWSWKLNVQFQLYLTLSQEINR